MKICKLTNQHIPIWSMLNGDHALKKHLPKISKQLIKEPNFLCPLENRLRYEIFLRERKWIADSWSENPSFAIVEITLEELMTFNTCFTGISFKDFVDEHVKCFNDPKHKFLITREKDNFEKPKQYITTMKQIVKSMIDDSYFSVKLADIDDFEESNSQNLWTATNRSMLVKTRSGDIKIVDGTHRLTAFASLHAQKQKYLPKKLYAFYTEK